MPFQRIAQPAVKLEPFTARVKSDPPAAIEGTPKDEIWGAGFSVKVTATGVTVPSIVFVTESVSVYVPSVMPLGATDMLTSLYVTPSDGRGCKGMVPPDEILKPNGWLEELICRNCGGGFWPPTVPLKDMLAGETVIAGSVFGGGSVADAIV